MSYTKNTKLRSSTVHSSSPEEAVALAESHNRLLKSAYRQRISQIFDTSVSEGKFYPKPLLTTSR